MEAVYGLFAAPLLAALSAALTRRETAAGLWQALFSGCMMICAALIAGRVVFGQMVLAGWGGVLYIDALSALNILLVSAVGLLAALYSKGYMQHELALGRITKRQFKLYYILFHLFIMSMLLASVVGNLGLLWVGIELTTLISALLVAFYGTPDTLEAAWKYLIMGSVGIAFALLGIIFIYMAALGVTDAAAESLEWSALVRCAGQLTPRWLEIGFVFVLVGFGTKAGLAPMHFWLPDAYSQAPVPVSAVLSGVLSNTVVYALFRIYAIADAAQLTQAADYLGAFGLISIALTVPFIIVQPDLKRMLAYSSVEHMGITTLGMGIGGWLGTYGALLHMVNNSLTKSLLFFSAGIICYRYHTKQMERITGLLKGMPLIGTMFLVAALAITGAPPFCVFVSEFTILMGGFAAGRAVAASIAAVFIVLIFAGMMYYVIKMVFGPRPSAAPKRPVSRFMVAASALPFIFIIVAGFKVPPVLDAIITAAATALKGAM